MIAPRKIIISFLFLVFIFCQVRADKPNVIFILADDLGWMDLGCYGSKYYETPALDQLAKEGILFTAAYAPHPVCGPSRAGIMAGKMPVKTGNVGVTGSLSTHEKTMAEAFKENGYTTYFTGKWHLGMTEGRHPANQGFDEIVGVNYAGQPGSYFYPYEDIGQDWIGGKRRVIIERDVLGLSGGKEGEFLTDRLTDEAIDFIQNNREKPFFMYFSHYAVHTPLQGKEEYIKHYEPKGNELDTRDVLEKIDDRAYSRIRQSNPVYAANVQSLDESVGKIMNTLRQLGLEENTIIVFTSDNGGFSTTKGGTPQMPTSNLPLRFGKGWMYEGGIRVPAIVKYPKKVESGTKSDQVICGYDFYPTLLSLAGLPLLPNQHVDGVNVFNPKENSKLNKREMYWYYPLKHVSGHTPSAAMRQGDYKLILDLDTEEVKLYNVKKDISEDKELSVENKELTLSMKNRLVSFLNKNKPVQN
ncbi:sulfatase [Reichenbachiella sp. MALMAid0571]|uniref:sulfatase n=1 Tax=Reichenbachiella sp. MALMAid0571 TaxID=3143939 RepID=UPI0032E02D4A